MNWSKPRRTFESVVDELTNGLGSGTIVLSDNEPPLKEEFVRHKQSTSDLTLGPDPKKLAAQQGKEKRESYQDIHSSRQEPPPIFEQNTIGKSICIKGEIKGAGSLVIDGKVEGGVNLPGNHVIIAGNGRVEANINAHDITIIGKVRGCVAATGRVDLRSGGELSGNIAAARICIEDGAYFKGGIDIRKPGEFEDEFELDAHANAHGRVQAQRFA